RDTVGDEPVVLAVVETEELVEDVLVVLAERGRAVVPRERDAAPRWAEVVERTDVARVQRPDPSSGDHVGIGRETAFVVTRRGGDAGLLELPEGVGRGALRR